MAVEDEDERVEQEKLEVADANEKAEGGEKNAVRISATPDPNRNHGNHDDDEKAQTSSRCQQKESRSPLFVPIGLACKQERGQDGTFLRWQLESLSWALIESGGEMGSNFTSLIGSQDESEDSDCCLSATLANAVKQLEDSIGGRDCLLVSWGPLALRQHLHPAAKRAKLELPKLFDEYVDLSKLELSDWLGNLSGAGNSAPPSPSSSSPSLEASAPATPMQIPMQTEPASCLCCHQIYLPAYLHPAQQQQQAAENCHRQQVWPSEEMLKFLSCTESHCEPQTTERLVEIMSELLGRLLADGHQFKRIERIKRRVEVGLCKPGGPLEQRVVRARGLPWQATEQDIADFFAGLNIARGGVGLCLSRQGRRNGEALIQFESHEQRNLALARHKHFMGARYIEVYRASADDFLSVAAGYNNKAQAFLSRGAQVIVRMRGLPFTCSARQILDFFHDCQLLGGNSEEAILFVKNQDEKPTGDAFVLFPNEQQAQRALQKHKQNIGTRYVELFRSSISEAQQVLSISSIPSPGSSSPAASSPTTGNSLDASSPPSSGSSRRAASATANPVRQQQAISAPKPPAASATSSTPVTYAQAAGQQHQQEAAKRELSPEGKPLPLTQPPVVDTATELPPDPEPSMGQQGANCEQQLSSAAQSPLSSLSGGSSVAGSSGYRSSANGSGSAGRRSQQQHHQHQYQQAATGYGRHQQHHHYAHQMHHQAAAYAPHWAPQASHRHHHHYQPHLTQAAYHQHHFTTTNAHPSYPNYQFYPAPPPQYCTMAGSQAVEQQHLHCSRKRDCIRLRGLPFEAQVEDVLYFLGERSKEILFQGVHMVYSPQGQPSGEAIIQMSSATSASQVAQEFHKKVMSVGKKQRYIEVLPCSIDDMNLTSGSAGGLLLPRVPLLAPTAYATGLHFRPAGVASASSTLEQQAEAAPAPMQTAPAAAVAVAQQPAGNAGTTAKGPATSSGELGVTSQRGKQPVANLVPAAAAVAAAAAYYPVLYYYPPPPPQALAQQQQIHLTAAPAATPYHC